LFYSAAGYARDIQEGLRAGAPTRLIPQVINFLAEYRERINKVCSLNSWHGRCDIAF